MLYLIRGLSSNDTPSMHDVLAKRLGTRVTWYVSGSNKGKLSIDFSAVPVNIPHYMCEGGDLYDRDMQFYPYCFYTSLRDAYIGYKQLEEQP